VARFRAPANVQLRRAQIILLLAALIPTIFLIATGIVLLAIGNDTPSLVVGILVLTFCTTSLTGYILGSIFMSRGFQDRSGRARIRQRAGCHRRPGQGQHRGL
jgi:membrane protein implicated in regulation of membrane protease activity